MRFIDTNILLYAISRDPAEQDKAKRANDVLAEFCWGQFDGRYPPGEVSEEVRT